ncbi:MAG: TolB family protein [Caldilineaceae bacterium]|nr:TolB family protein [Caldilineaceae bacterium]
MTPTQSPLGDFTGQSDIGNLHHVGSCTYDPDGQIYTISGAGANIWGDHDDFRYVWRRMTGNFIVTAQVNFVGEGVELHRKLGWMARSTLDTASPHVTTAIHGDGLTSLQFRRGQGARTEEIVASITHADVIQLERRGNSYIMSVARYGETFHTIQVADLDLGDEIYVGLAVCSHNADVVETAEFRNVRIVVPVAEGVANPRANLGSRLEIMEVATGHRRVIYRTDDIFEAPNWTLDGKALIYNSGGRLYRYDLATNRPTLIDTEPVIQNNNDHVISFDGTMLAISSRSEEDQGSVVYTVPITGGVPKRITAKAPSYLHGWSPDGKYLVYTAQRNGDFDIYRIAADGSDGDHETQLTTAPGLDDGPEYSPDGRYIYFNSVRSGTMQIWRMAPDGSNQEQVTGDEYNNWFAHVSPDDKWIIFVSYTQEVAPNDHPAAKRVYLRLMPIRGAGPSVVAYLYGGQGTMNVPSWSPDSKYVAFVSNTVPF